MAQKPCQAVIFDLLTALLNSWSLWNKVADSDGVGFNWRARYLQLTYQAGLYRSYEGIIKEAAHEAGVPEAHAEELLQRWSELEPWPETPQVLHAFSEKVPIAVVTNASIALANMAVTCLGVAMPTVVTAEEAGYYKPRPRPTAWLWTGCNVQQSPCSLSPDRPRMFQEPRQWVCRSGIVSGPNLLS